MGREMILDEISSQIQLGKTKLVKQLVQQALDEGIPARTVLEEGLMSGMSVVGEKFKNNEIFVPEVLVAARAMKHGSALLKDALSEDGVSAKGKVCVGTVKGDLHDIGKNLVIMMMESKGLEVVDLGTDVPSELFVDAVVNQSCQVVAMSALLTTTMPVMEEVIWALQEAGVREQVHVIVGGAPVTEDFARKINADSYAADASTAADMAVAYCA